jgi:maltose O-acetyltransferase
MEEGQKGMRERMFAGELYIADDPELAWDSARAQRLTHQINTMDPTDHLRRRSRSSSATTSGSAAPSSSAPA